MEGSLRVVPVFLGMSSELESDRQELGNFFAGLNDIVAGHGVYFRLVRWQQGLPDCLSREASSVLEGCELAAFLFFTTVDGEVEGAFDAALAAFREKGSPEIVTWFHVVPEGKSVASELEAFRARLKGELHHYYKTYDRIDTVELELMLQLARGTLGGGAVDIGEEGALTIATDELCLWGKPVMGLSGVPAYQGWTAIAQAQSQLAAIEADYQEARARCLEDPNDASAEEAYGDLLLERKSLRAELERAQRDFLKAMREMARRTSSTQFMTERQRQAYRLLEAGKADEAITLLDRVEIAGDARSAEAQKRAIEAAYQAACAPLLAQLRANVQELLQCAELLGSRPMTSETLRELEETLREAADIEGRSDGLGITARVRLAQFLLFHGRRQECLALLETIGPAGDESASSDGMPEDEVLDYVSLLHLRAGAEFEVGDYAHSAGTASRAIAIVDSFGESMAWKLRRAILLELRSIALSALGQAQESSDDLAEAQKLCDSSLSAPEGAVRLAGFRLWVRLQNRSASLLLKDDDVAQARLLLTMTTMNPIASASKEPAVLHEVVRANLMLSRTYEEGSDEQIECLNEARAHMAALLERDPERFLETARDVENRLASAQAAAARRATAERASGGSARPKDVLDLEKAVRLWRDRGVQLRDSSPPDSEEALLYSIDYAYELTKRWPDRSSYLELAKSLYELSYLYNCQSLFCEAASELREVVDVAKRWQLEQDLPMQDILNQQEALEMFVRMGYPEGGLR